MTKKKKKKKEEEEEEEVEVVNTYKMARYSLKPIMQGGSWLC